MTPEFLYVLGVIALFSVVQSLFGMGILLFGTPTLLLMGYDFITVLGYLLPASFAISLLQVMTADSPRFAVSKHLFLLCIPGISVGLWLADVSVISDYFMGIIGLTLLLTAMVRIHAPSQALLKAFLLDHLPGYHLIMGIAHGLTNLGGGMLAILASGTQVDKEAIRRTVAAYYLVFSVIQMLTIVLVLGRPEVLTANLVTAVVSAIVFISVGDRIFLRTSNPSYNRVLTAFIAFYGAIVLLKM